MGHRTEKLIAMSEPTSAARVALITGASGGLGRALVAEFLVQGWCVAAGFHRDNLHSETDRLLPVPLDVTSRNAVHSAVAQVLARWQRIDLLINNAGITADNLSWQLTDDDWQRVLDVNLKGAFLCSQAVLRPMLKQRDGHILNIASFSARTGLLLLALLDSLGEEDAVAVGDDLGESAALGQLGPAEHILLVLVQRLDLHYALLRLGLTDPQDQGDARLQGEL
jgi:hypothetical protein